MENEKRSDLPNKKMDCKEMLNILKLIEQKNEIVIIDNTQPQIQQK